MAGPSLYILGARGSSYRPEGEEEASRKGWRQLRKREACRPVPGFTVSGSQEAGTGIRTSLFCNLVTQWSQTRERQRDGASTCPLPVGHTIT